jgi:hypothetical protein
MLDANVIETKLEDMEDTIRKNYSVASLSFQESTEKKRNALRSLYQRRLNDVGVLQRKLQEASTDKESFDIYKQYLRENCGLDV